MFLTKSKTKIKNAMSLYISVILHKIGVSGDLHFTDIFLLTNEHTDQFEIKSLDDL